MTQQRLSNAMAKKKPIATRTTHLLPFDQLSWEQFEQLTLRLARKKGYKNAEHFGAAGNDKARDIVDRKKGAYFQCKNRRALSPKSIAEEVHKLQREHKDVRRVVFVVAGKVSATARDRAIHLLGDKPCDFWCGAELDAMVKEFPTILRDYFDYPKPRTNSNVRSKKQVARTVIGSITVDQSGNVVESDDSLAELLSELLVKFENSHRIGRILVQLTVLQETEAKLKQKNHQSADYKVQLSRFRIALIDIARRIERGLTLLALSSRYSVPVSDKARISRSIVRKILELAGFVEVPPQRPLKSQGFTIEIFALPSPYPRQLQLGTSRKECEEIERKLGFPVLATVMNGQPCSRLPADFLWFRAYPAMIVATVWFKAYPNDDRLAAETCDYDNWLFGLA